MMIEGIPLPKLVEHLVQQAITADAEMQLLQRKGWMEMSRGRPLVEGMDHLAYLGVQELRFSFWVEPVKPGLLARIRKCYRLLLGKAQPPGVSQAVTPSLPGLGGFNVTVIISRKDNRFVSQTTPEPHEMGDVYVVGLST